MDYNRIILELLERIQVLEQKVARLEQQVEAQPAEQANAPSGVNLDAVSAKYRALAKFLVSSGRDSVTLDYPTIESILRFPLPQTAHNFMQSYWANTTTHSYASSWLAVGYKAKVNVADKTVTFEKNYI